MSDWSDTIEALREAGEVIHSEFCTNVHHPYCARISFAVQKAEAALAAEHPSNHTSVQRAANLED